MWSCKWYMPHTITDLGLWFLHQWTAHERGPPEAIGFDFESRQKQKAILDAGGMAVHGVVPGTPLGRAGSYPLHGELFVNSPRRKWWRWGIGQSPERYSGVCNAAEVHRLETTSGPAA